jgi:tRNA (adenine57-N1/adenine58-N1)-methyltransferase
MNQLEKLAAALRQNDFFDIECSEQIVRTIEARDGKTRHSFRAIGHTTYVAFARKVTTPANLRKILEPVEQPEVESEEIESSEDESLSTVKK